MMHSRGFFVRIWFATISVWLIAVEFYTAVTMAQGSFISTIREAVAPSLPVKTLTSGLDSKDHSIPYIRQ